MFIQTEETPNPVTLKFLPGRTVMPQGTFSATSLVEAAPSLLAENLLQIAGVVGVFFGADFISVSKDPQTPWYELKPLILGTLLEHFVAQLPVMRSPETGSCQVPSASKAQAPEKTFDPVDEAIVRQIKELLDTRIRPAVAQDGGDIVFHDFQDGVLYLQMQGACSNCPSSSATLKSGVENMMRHYVPEVLEVRAVA